LEDSEEEQEEVDDQNEGQAQIKTEEGMDVDQHERLKNSSVREVAKLHDSPELKEVMEQMRLFKGRDRAAKDVCGPVEADPEYKLIVRANNLVAEIDEDIGNLHKFAKDKYNKRFPELETLVVNPLEFLLAAKELGNDVLKAKNNPVLEAFLTQATIMVVSVTASTTQGADMSEEDLRVVYDACDVAVELSECKKEIFEYVESRMAFIAPNLSVIIGASTAAMLMGAAGGLTNLSKMPAGHVSLLGQQKKTVGGFSQRSHTMPHTGFIFNSELVQSMPPDLRRKVSRVVSNKCSLAARVDAQHESTDGTVGREFRDEVERKADKLQEPPPVKAVKALPAPVDPIKKRRGGRRVRKMKERYAVTELRKQANRMNFGELEEDLYQEDLGYTRGNIGKGGVGGGIRAAQVDERTKVRISQTLKKNMQKQQATWGGTTSIKKQVSGTASSVAFTPLQGLEIVNPNAAEGTRAEEANAKYFSSSASFVKVKTPAPK